MARPALRAGSSPFLDGVDGASVFPPPLRATPPPDGAPRSEPARAGRRFRRSGAQREIIGRLHDLRDPRQRVRVLRAMSVPSRDGDRRRGCGSRGAARSATTGAAVGALMLASAGAEQVLLRGGGRGTISCDHRTAVASGRRARAVGATAGSALRPRGTAARHLGLSFWTRRRRGATSSPNCASDMPLVGPAGVSGTREETSGWGRGLSLRLRREGGRGGRPGGRARRQQESGRQPRRGDRSPAQSEVLLRPPTRPAPAPADRAGWAAGSGVGTASGRGAGAGGRGAGAIKVAGSTPATDSRLRARISTSISSLKRSFRKYARLNVDGEYGPEKSSLPSSRRKSPLDA